MTGKPEECHCCGFATDALTLYKDQPTTIAGGGKTRQDDFWYCDLCATTMASTFSRYPGQQPSGTEILKAICLIGNRVLAALAKGGG